MLSRLKNKVFLLGKSDYAVMVESSFDDIFAGVVCRIVLPSNMLSFDSRSVRNKRELIFT